jgi:DNA-directed RNA polymerase subunit L
MFKKSIEILIEKTRNFIDNMGNLEKVTIKNSSNIDNFYELEIKNETYTLLNVIQSCVYNLNFRKNKTTDLEYIGYYNPHPLDNKMILRIKFTNDQVSPKVFLTKNLEILIEQLNIYVDEWTNNFLDG